MYLILYFNFVWLQLLQLSGEGTDLQNLNDSTQIQYRQIGKILNSSDRLAYLS